MVLAEILGGKSMPFPPFPESWIAFTHADDGTAIELYPTSHKLEPDRANVVCKTGEPDNPKSFAHVAIASPLKWTEVMVIGKRENWLCRRCNRGPFQCVELWIENRLLAEVLDRDMLDDYRVGMTLESWAAMFDL